MKALLANLLLLLAAAATNAFVSPASRHQMHPTSPSSFTLKSNNDNSNDEKSSEFNAAAGELVSTLAKLDQEWKLASVAGTQNRWKERLVGEIPNQQKVYLLEPPSRIPSCVVCFVGGAGLGQFPHIAYGEFLTLLSNQLNAAVIAPSYQVKLNHFDLAKETGEAMRQVRLDYLEEVEDYLGEQTTTMPTYCVAHSLGCKLATIDMAAMNVEYSGIGFVSYNNFSFGRTISMVRDLAQTVRTVSSEEEGAENSNDDLSDESVINQLFQFAETLVGGLGVEFSPSPDEMVRLLQLKYLPEIQQKTRFFSFDDDLKLDNAKDLQPLYLPQAQVSGLPGTHLTPVFLKLDLADLADIPAEARDMASQTMGGYQGASFGDPANMQQLVDELYNFILNKPPSQEPKWASPQQVLPGTTMES